MPAIHPPIRVGESENAILSVLTLTAFSSPGLFALNDKPPNGVR
jgi:hypothetical protein